MSFDELTDWERDQVRTRTIDELQGDDVTLFDRARAAVPPPLSWPEAPGNLESIFFSLVAPSWPHFEDVLTRYAAAKAFASWSLYLGDGMEAAAETARIAHAVLRIECARQCRRSAARSIASCCPTRSSRATSCSCTTPIPNARYMRPAGGRAKRHCLARRSLAISTDRPRD